MNIILVGIGGALGSILRYLTNHLVGTIIQSSFPYATFAVNILGSLAIGIIFGLAEKHEWFSHELRIFLAVGFCGGFTTFSAFALENIVLLEQKDYLTFALYCSLSVVLCLAAVFIGVLITK